MNQKKAATKGKVITSEKIIALEQTIAESYSNIAGIVVLKNGKVRYENYFNQTKPDARPPMAGTYVEDTQSAEKSIKISAWPLAGECTENILSGSISTHVFSVTKSIISLLIGIAIDHGHIAGVDRKVLDFFPNYPVKRGEKTIQRITVENLLTMTAPYKYKSAPYTRYFTSDDWVKTALDLLGGKEPIGTFRYTPLIGPDILSGILVKATGQSVLDFATQHLFAPLGITVAGNVVFHSKKDQMDFIKAKHTSGWVAGPGSINTAGWGLALTPMEMAKIGQLCLNQGRHEGKQLVSAAWLDESTREHSRWEEQNLRYGYLWWIIDDKERSFAAMGDGGNVIYVNPGRDMVVSIASYFKPRVADRIGFIKDHIEPLFDGVLESQAR